MNSRRNFYRYLPRIGNDSDWGARVLDAGYGSIPPHAAYPPAGHPEDHAFSWEKGRRLEAYTWVYITAGSGIFDSEASGEMEIHAGSVFLVFPNVWHRYRPDPAAGWDEYWVECEGELLDGAIRRSGFLASAPVMEVGLDEPLLRCFLDIADTIEEEAPGFEPIIGLRSVEIVARIRSLLQASHSPGTTDADKLVKHTLVRMRESLEGALDLQLLAQELGISYSTFRRLFKNRTGRAPGDYFIEMKMNRARQLLAGKSIQQVADQLGFESVYYFSRLFKAKSGKPPGSYRTR
jgi:AraC-like DNA-binding protein